MRARWISGYEGRYKITDDGRVLSYLNTWGRPRPGAIVRKLGRCRRGYPTVTLRLPGRKLRCVKVHRLVAAVFVSNPLGLPQVNHKDLIKSNNRWRNLEWMTNAQNRDHAVASGVKLGAKSPRRGIAQHAHIFTVRKVRRIRRMIARGMNDRAISKVFGCSDGAIYMIRRRINWSWLT